jgi:6-pyruvoyltetrahydropterin/6-carboxytetrahydropterin synthase
VKYRICKSFEVESGHMLMKHPGRCKFPHGHSRRVEVVVSAPFLDENDMVCDFKALKLAVSEFVDRFDHSLAVNSQDERAKGFLATGNLAERMILVPNQDPTTEVMARLIYEELAGKIGQAFTAKDGNVYRLPAGLTVERVRVTETSSSWAEYGM